MANTVSCEVYSNAIRNKLREIHEIYRRYNADGKYLSLCLMKQEDGGWTCFANNAWYEGGDPKDQDNPVNFIYEIQYNHSGV